MEVATPAARVATLKMSVFVLMYLVSCSVCALNFSDLRPSVNNFFEHFLNDFGNPSLSRKNGRPKNVIWSLPNTDGHSLPKADGTKKRHKIEGRSHCRG